MDRNIPYATIGAMPQFSKLTRRINPFVIGASFPPVPLSNPIESESPPLAYRKYIRRSRKTIPKNELPAVAYRYAPDANEAPNAKRVVGSYVGRI